MTTMTNYHAKYCSSKLLSCEIRVTPEAEKLLDGAERNPDQHCTEVAYV